MFGCPMSTNVPPFVTAIPLAAVGSAGMQLAAWLLSGIGAGLVLVGMWHVLSSRWPSQQAVEPPLQIDVLDEAA
jgi:hypothetical protein